MFFSEILDIVSSRHVFLPRGVETSLQPSRVLRCKNKYFQLWLEDDKIAQPGQYIILFVVSSFELPTTLNGGFCFGLLTKREGENMKKAILVIACLLCSLSAVSSEYCANGQGTTVKGVNGNVYCLSHAKMNWWSANAWCDSAQGVSQLVHPSEDCDCTGYDGCDITAPCPNLKVGSANVWTRGIKNESNAYYLHLSSGWLDLRARTDEFSVLCK